MIGFGICIGSQEKFDRFAKGGLGRVIEDDSVVAESTDNTSIFTAYNEMLDHFSTMENLEALVLLHEDVEFLDGRLAQTIRDTFSDPDVAIMGAIGASDIKSLSWWDANGAGRVRETRGVIDFKYGFHDVDVVDGLLLVLSPWAIQNLRFDEETFNGFHAYDVDICLQARTLGKRVVVNDISLMHHTKGGLGNVPNFMRADESLRRKWFEFMDIEEPEPVAPIAIDTTCLLCGGEMKTVATQTKYSVLDCVSCGFGATNPAPARILESDGIWEDTYGGGDGRLQMRPQWMHEAQLRLDWIHHYAPGKTILELGGGTGEFVATAAENGWDAHGAEISEWAAEEARKLGANVLTGDLDDWMVANPSQEVDVITAFHVFEHIHEPREFLKSVHKALRPDGLLVLEMPNYNSEMAKNAPFVWIASNLEDHVFHYTPETLRTILEQEGFVVDLTLEFTTRVYESAEIWEITRGKHEWFGCKDASKEMLRVVAHRPTA